jgi:hexosaminidase
VLWKLESRSKENIIRTNHWINSKTGPFDVSAMKQSGYYNNPILVTSNSTLEAILLLKSIEKLSPVGDTLKQKFYFNKSTGKKIILTNEASKSYPGDGAFTLVNGVINEKGLAKSKEFLGFSGADCDAVIDLGSLQSISFVVVNTLSRPASWIYRPQTAEVLGSGDGKTWYPLKLTDDFQEKKDGAGKGTMTMAFKATYAQYVKVVVKNWGIIPEGNPGAGNKAWLFIDEIEVN